MADIQAGYRSNIRRDFIPSLQPKRSKDEAPLHELLHVLRSNFINAHLFSQLAQTLKGDLPIDFGIEGVIFSYTHVVPGMDLGALLPNQDIAGADNLPPYRLIPNLCPALSLPFRELPPAFLCAMLVPLLLKFLSSQKF